MEDEIPEVIEQEEQNVEQEVEATEEVEETEGEQEAQEQDEDQREESADDQARKEEARKQFAARQAKRAEKERLERENEYLKSIVYQNQQPKAQSYAPQAYRDPNEPILDNYLSEGRTAEEWSRDHRMYLENDLEIKRQTNSVKQQYNKRLEEYAKANKDIFEYEAHLASFVNRNLAHAIVNSEKTGQVIEELALNEELAYTLNNITDPYLLGREIAKIENRLSSSKRSFSGAPRPPSINKGNSPVKSGGDLSGLSKSEYRKLRNSQRR